MSWIKVWVDQWTICAAGQGRNDLVTGGDYLPLNGLSYNL